MKVVHSIWFSKLGYGLQLCATTRIKENEPYNTDMKDIQIAQNRLLRMLNGCTLKDKISTKDMLKKLDLPSVNQLAVEIKLTEVWKSLNDNAYPINLDKGANRRGENDRTLRPGSIRNLKDFARTKIGENSFCISAGKLWNQAPQNIKEANTLSQAKTLIKETYCRTIPI